MPARLTLAVKTEEEAVTLADSLKTVVGVDAAVNRPVSTASVLPLASRGESLPKTFNGPLSRRVRWARDRILFDNVTRPLCKQQADGKIWQAGYICSYQWSKVPTE